MAEYQREWKARLISNPEAFEKWKAKRKAQSKHWKLSQTNKAVKKTKNQQMKNNLTNAYVAMAMGYKVSEVPTEIIEIKRLQLKLTRLTRKKVK